MACSVLRPDRGRQARAPAMRSRFVSTLVLGVVAAIAALHAAAATPAAGVAGEEAPAMMARVVDRWLVAQRADGFQPYGFDFLEGRELEPEAMSRPNLIRQALAGYALAAYFQRSPEPRIKAALQRALVGFKSRSVPIGKSTLQRWIEQARVLSLPVGRFKLRATLERFGLLYRPEGPGLVPTPDTSYANATPGAAALALLTELAYSGRSGDESFADLRAGWREGLLALHVPGRGFRADAAAIDTDDYYANGEGWLALAVYADRFPADARLREVLADVDDALIARYSSAPHPGFFHWGAMAAAQRLRTTRDARFAQFVRAQSVLFLERFSHRLKAEENNCSTMEGVAAALPVLASAGLASGDLAQRMQAWLRAEYARLPGLQIRPGQDRLVLREGAVLLAPRLREFPGSFLAGRASPFVRVDLDGHCLSASLMIERDRLLER